MEPPGSFWEGFYRLIPVTGTPGTSNIRERHPCDRPPRPQACTNRGSLRPGPHRESQIHAVALPLRTAASLKPHNVPSALVRRPAGEISGHTYRIHVREY